MIENTWPADGRGTEQPIHNLALRLAERFRAGAQAFDYYSPTCLARLNRGRRLILAWPSAESRGVNPIARVRAQVLVGGKPYDYIEDPIVVLGWARAYDADLNRVNVKGGAIALGHLIGVSGNRSRHSRGSSA